MYEKIKKQNGERFAKAIRNYHNGIFDIPNLDERLRFAGRDAEPLIPYLMSLLAANDDKPAAGNPFDLLAKAGYDAFYADTLEKQNSIARYYAKGELLCTFDDAARHEQFYIVHAVKVGAADLKREDFVGKEQREDEYGTSVISIQMLKAGGFISIKNRYNHAVANCDNTFHSNPDEIIDGLSAALRDHFNVDFRASRRALPEGYALFGERIVQYHREMYNIYYGDQFWVDSHNGEIEIHEANRENGDALFDGFLFDNNNKALYKIDSDSKDSFAEAFNSIYGGNKGLAVQNGNLTLNGKVLIGAEKSQIKKVHLPGLEVISKDFLSSAKGLEEFSAPDLKTMGEFCFLSAPSIRVFSVPKLVKMDNYCLGHSYTLKDLKLPSLEVMGNGCFEYARNLEEISFPALIEMGKNCFRNVKSLKTVSAPVMKKMEGDCFWNTKALFVFDAPALDDVPEHLKKYMPPADTQAGHGRPEYGLF